MSFAASSSPDGTEASAPKRPSIVKRSKSSEGLADPVPPPRSPSPTVRVKQEKPDSPVGISSCSESVQMVGLVLNRLQCI